MIIQRWLEKFKQHEETASFCYENAGGNARLAKRNFRSAMVEVYKLDAMTIVVLVQIAIRVYMWAKEQGYLSAYPLESVPMVAILEACEAEGDLD